MRTIVPARAIDVVAPRSSDEAGFDNLHDWPGIETRLVEIARTKLDDVLDQLKSLPSKMRQIVVAADTIVVVRDTAGAFHVLGQPPNDLSWRDVVRRWFREYYAGQTHTVATALWVADAPPVVPQYRVVKSDVTFHDDVDRWLEWYLATDEPLGKAGGYAIQGAGSIFVAQVAGSMSNVIGLPLAELLELIDGPKST